MFSGAAMKVVIIGQQDFGKSVLEKFLERGDQVVAVFCAPEKPGARPDPLKVAAVEKGVTVHQFASLKTPEAEAAMRSLDADIGVMAYVLQFAPQALVNIPRLATIQFHPSVLPRYRGPSSINWPIIRGDTHTGLTIFRPTDGLDEGPVILQKTCEIGADETIGEVYFSKLYPMGVAAMIEAADLVFAGGHHEVVQDEKQATYEGWCRDAEAKINWANHVDFTYNLIRGCNPAPGAWTTLNGKKLQIFDARKHAYRTFGDTRGKVGEVTDVSETGFMVGCQGGRIQVLRVKAEDDKKIGAGEFAASGGVAAGAFLGS